MPSPIESAKPDRTPGLGVLFERWNRRIHYYAGLFLLLFVWLFALTGLLLNHPSWAFHESWQNRKETNTEQALTPLSPELRGDLDQAREIMRQLGIEGEILWTATRTDPNLFVFQVRRPGHFYFLSANLQRKIVAVRHSEVNVWGVLKVLHVFSGIPSGDTRNTRDWVLTSVWVFAMDAVAAGLVVMVLSSLFMWYRLPQKRAAGAIVLGAGTLLCGLFCVGLRWIS